VISPTAQRLFDALPPTYGLDVADADPLVIRILEAFADDLDRARLLLEVLRDSSIPARATDEVGQLTRWLRAMNVPTAADQPESARRAQLVAAFRGRRLNTGQRWRNALTVAIGSTAWTIEPNTPGANQDTLTIPYGAGLLTAGQVEAYARRIHPAHRQLIMAYDQGFIVGVSRVGDAL
jgi:hypothetical protein